MSHEHLLVKIEKLRKEMIDLANKGRDYNKVLQASQELDKYIAEYQRTTSKRRFSLEYKNSPGGGNCNSRWFLYAPKLWSNIIG